MRLFLAILFPDEIRQHLAGVQRTLADRIEKRWRVDPPKINWTKRENLHATLKFLGEVPDADVPPLCSALSAAALGPAFSLRVGGLSHFPPRGPINVIVADLDEETGAAAVLARAIDHAIHPLGFPLESRPYQPHATLGRPRGTVNSRDWCTLNLQQPPGPIFVVDSLSLMRSDLTKDGPVYSQCAQFKLTTALPQTGV